MTKAEKIAELKRLEQEMQEDKHAYEVAEQEFINYGGLWERSVSEQMYNAYHKTCIKVLRLREEIEQMK